MTIPRAAAAEAALIGRPWTEADASALLVDLDRLEQNIAEMAAMARDAGVDLRPHFKTHKSVEVARRQVAAGAIGMTVAWLDEAAVPAPPPCWTRPPCRPPRRAGPPAVPAPRPSCHTQLTRAVHACADPVPAP
jgi:hypothetical protein